MTPLREPPLPSFLLKQVKQASIYAEPQFKHLLISAMFDLV
jgi:hypothetical protein